MLRFSASHILAFVLFSFFLCAGYSTFARADVSDALAKKDIAALESTLNAASPDARVDLATSIINYVKANVADDKDFSAKAMTTLTRDLLANPLPKNEAVLSAVKELRAALADLSDETRASQPVGEIYAAILSLVGSPDIVALDPVLYSQLLTDAATYVQLARGSANPTVQTILQFGPPPTNQLGTTTQSFF